MADAGTAIPGASLSSASATQHYPAETTTVSTPSGTTTTVAHAVDTKGARTAVPSPQHGSTSRNTNHRADAQASPSSARAYTEKQREILQRGRLAGQGRAVPTQNPLSDANGSERLDSHGQPKRLRATATARRVKHDEKEKKPLFPSWLAKLLLVVGQLIIMALLIASVAVPLYKLDNTTDAARCYNYWGRVKCGTYKYTTKGEDTWECNARANTVRTSLVFNLLGLAFSVIIIVMLLLKYVFKTRALNVVVFALTFLNCLFIMLAFALVAVVYNVPTCNRRSLSKLFSYGPTLPLLVVAWVLTLAYLALLFFILP